MSRTRNSSLLGKFTVSIIICCFFLPAQAQYGGGTGEPNDPYLIYDANQMNAIGADANDWDKHFKLMADIDLSAYTGTSFNIIGNYNKPFTGLFDGSGQTISNFTYTSTDAKYAIGLFGYVAGENAEIKNLGLIGPNVDAGTRYFVGSLVGSLHSGTITNCYAQDANVSGNSNVGGLAGLNYYGTISNCYATGSIVGEDRTGGLAGYNTGTISNCYATGNVAGEYRVGGLIGHNSRHNSSGKITNCYTTGNVAGDRKVGGLVGAHYEGTITNCYATGSVTGMKDTGGLVAYNSAYVINSYWNIETSGQPISAGGEGKISAQMMMANTFLNWGACDGVWTINEYLDYPRLAWEEKPGEPIVNAFPLEGDGDSNSPYLIYTTDELNVIGQLPCVWDKHFKVMADIDLTQYTGTEFNIIAHFTGVFDGNGHTISNFTYSSRGANYIGLFGYIDDPNAEIKNLGLLDPDIHAGTGNYVGAMVGWLSGGTITNCYVEGGSVSGDDYVGGLMGWNNSGTITNCYSTASVTGDWLVGGLAGENEKGIITNCYSTGSVAGNGSVGGLVGDNSWGTIINCNSTGSISGRHCVGGLVGYNDEGAITNCYSTGSAEGDSDVGGLVGVNYGTTTNCYSIGSVSGGNMVGGLAGNNSGTITNCYVEGSSVSGNSRVGGLVGQNGFCNFFGCGPGTITDSYSTGSVSGDEFVGGLVGWNENGMVLASFWDIETSGQTTSDGGTGLPTIEMQMQITFTDTGWDFNTPVWTIDEGVDYPRLWWQFVSVLHAEPEVTLGTSNTISWEHVAGDVEYYAECAEDANFTNIIYNTGWITETSCEFTDLEVGKRYWYSVKARNIAGTETDWSNVESSLQVILTDAVDMMLDPNTLKNKNLKTALLNKINAAMKMIDEGLYEAALNKLHNDILQKTDGCAKTGRPDKNDWIITCEGQNQIYPLIIETIEYVQSLME